MFHLRYPFQPGSLLGYIIEQADTGKFFNFATKAFEVHSTDFIGKMVERWRDDDHDGDGKIDDQTGDVTLKFLRGVYANTGISINSADKHDAHSPMGIDLGETLEPGEYYIYLIDRNEAGRVIDTVVMIVPGDGDATPVPEAPGPNVTFNIPENLDLRGNLSLNLNLPSEKSDIARGVRGQPTLSAATQELPQTATPLKVEAPVASGQPAQPALPPNQAKSRPKGKGR